MKVIETRFDGYNFRSRLEARYAVFFKYLRTPYEYEKEGYKLNGGLYLPDFFLPEVSLRNERYKSQAGFENGVWFEAKGRSHTDKEFKLCEMLGEYTRIPVILCEGLPDYTNSLKMFEFWPSWDQGMCFMKCFRCNKIKIEFLESSYSNCSFCGHDEDSMWEHSDILSAEINAKSARFEHGVSP